MNMRLPSQYDAFVLDLVQIRRKSGRLESSQGKGEGTMVGNSPQEGWARMNGRHGHIQGACMNGCESGMYKWGRYGGRSLGSGVRLRYGGGRGGGGRGGKTGGRGKGLTN